jgi:hypothetical protein
MSIVGFTVQGCCPMGCGQTLVLGEGGLVTCCSLECPRPDAATAILSDAGPEHLVELREEDYTVRHPLAERLDDALLSCTLHEHLQHMPPRKPGRYRVLADGESYVWAAA